MCLLGDKSMCEQNYVMEVCVCICIYVGVCVFVSFFSVMLFLHTSISFLIVILLL